MSEPTTTRNFRENLKHFFDLAGKNPIAINRGSERYVLMSENEFVKMKEEVFNLQKSLISTLQHLNGETAPEIDVDAGEEDDKIFQEFVAKYENRKGKKSKVG
jgi:PHD/YefM family antitoxin component YafN of YafNO toxin-antitoxin module